MKRAITVGIVILIGYPFSTTAQQAPEAALGPVAVLGDISDGQQKIISNRLRAFLSRHYNLISDDAYLAAEDEAFQSLEFDQCTETECVRLIQDFLQVERLFLLQIIREGELTQLNVSLFKEDVRRDEEDICENCTIANIYAQVETLANRLIQDDLNSLALESSQYPPSAESDSHEIWYYTTLGTGIGFSILSAIQYQKATELHDEAESKSSSDPPESKRLEAERDRAVQNMIISGVIGAIFLYMTISTDSENELEASRRGWQLSTAMNSDRQSIDPYIMIERRW